MALSILYLESFFVLALLQLGLSIMCPKFTALKEILFPVRNPYEEAVRGAGSALVSSQVLKARLDLFGRKTKTATRDTPE